MDEKTLGVIVAAIIAAMASILGIYWKSKADERLAELNSKSRVVQDLQIEYDKQLRAERMTAFQSLMKLMASLPKYPEPKPLTYGGLRTLTEQFRDWYFNEGGLLMTPAMRDCFFDFQEGCRIALQKQMSPDTTPDKLIADLKNYVKFDESKRSISPHIETIAKATISNGGQRPNTTRVEAEIVECLRKLASDLRTSMTDAILSRREVPQEK